MTFTSWLPDIPVIMRFRGRLLGVMMAKCGGDFQVASRVIISGLDKLTVGDCVYLASGVVILASTSVTLEDHVMIAFHSVITDGNHSSVNGTYRYGPRKRAPIVIGRGSWIGANCTICAGSRVGSNVAVAANSSVVGCTSDNVVVAGVPARVRRSAGNP